MRCSQDSCRPCGSNVLPLLLFDGLRNTLTRPSSSSHRNWRLLGMSLQTRYLPWLLQAGPSVHSAPVHSRLIDVFAWMSESNAGSTLRMSGSAKYVVGGASGPKSRGGLEITVGAERGVPCRAPCALVLLVVTIAAAAAPPMVAISWRLEMSVLICQLCRKA